MNPFKRTINNGFGDSKLSLPRTKLLLYLGRPNLEAADVPLGDDTEIGDDTPIRWMFLLPADADIRAATGWISGVGNLFYDAAGDPIAVFASEIAAWSSINQWNVLFHLVSADTETGRLAIYSQATSLATLNKALKVLREDRIDVSPSVFFNGVDTIDKTSYTGGPTYVPDNLGVLRTPGANIPTLQGLRLATTLAEGATLGPELNTNLNFINWSSDNPISWLVLGETGGNVITEADADGTPTVGGGHCKILSADGANIYMYIAGVRTIGKKYRIKVNLTKVYVNGIKVESDLSTSGAFIFATVGETSVETIAASTNLAVVRVSGVGSGAVIKSISIQELIPTYYDTVLDGSPIVTSTSQPTRTFDAGFTTATPSTTFKRYNPANPLVMPGQLFEPARTNKCTCRKANPVDTTGLMFNTSNASFVASIVDKPSEILAAGLSQLCNLGKVYRANNTGGTAGGCWIRPGNANVALTPHSTSFYYMTTSSNCSVRNIGNDSIITNIPASPTTLSLLKTENFTATVITHCLNIYIPFGTDFYFILPQLEEGAFATSPICEAADGSDPLTALTRAGTALTYPTAGKIKSNNMAFRMIVVPRASGQAASLMKSKFDNANYVAINISSTNAYLEVKLNNEYLSSNAAVTHVSGDVLEVVGVKSTVGIRIAVRKNRGSWVNGTLNASTNAKINAIIASSYQLGADSSANQFTGNIPLFETLFIPDGITDPLAWAKAQWGIA